MTSVFVGTLSGQGTQALAAECVPIDCDVNVSVIGPHVTTQGPDGHRRLANVGWIVFYNSTFSPPGMLGAESVTDVLWFNQESQDMPVNTVLGQTATHFAFWIQPGSEVILHVTCA